MAQSADPSNVAHAATARRVIAAQLQPIGHAERLHRGLTPRLNGLLSQPHSHAAPAATGHGMRLIARMVSSARSRRGTSFRCPRAGQMGSRTFVPNVRAATMAEPGLGFDAIGIPFLFADLSSAAMRPEPAF